MPEVKDLNQAEIAIIYTNIGRGHPSYLDGILQVLDDSQPSVAYFNADVFALSKGISLMAWKMIRRLYVWGGQGGVITFFYSLLRRFTGSGGGGLMHSLLGRDLRSYLAGYARPVVVAHPILARILSSQNKVIYQHGELAAPAEAMPRGCHKILVPLKETAQEFGKRGIAPEVMVVTGQCIETGFLPSAETAFEARLGRLSGDAPLHAALFSSGAYPANHLRQLGLAAVSLIQSGHHVYFYVGRSEKVADRFARYFARKKIKVGSGVSGEERLRMITSRDRRDENEKVARVLHNLDFFVAPAHERTNWTVGLGLPQFILTPHIGSYAPLNSAMALKQGAAVEFDAQLKPEDLGRAVGIMRSEGRLKIMARNGFGKYPRSGFVESTHAILDLGDNIPV
jgi:hypothetical protein